MHRNNLLLKTEESSARLFYVFKFMADKFVNKTGKLRTLFLSVFVCVCWLTTQLYIVSLLKKTNHVACT